MNSLLTSVLCKGGNLTELLMGDLAPGDVTRNAGLPHGYITTLHSSPTWFRIKMTLTLNDSVLSLRRHENSRHFKT